MNVTEAQKNKLTHMNKIPQTELEGRMKRFRNLMARHDANWEVAYIFTKVGLYYFTGTMQDGVLIIPRDGEADFWVRISYERALDESNFQSIKPMSSYRDAAAAYPKIPRSAYIETDFVPMALWERFSKYFPTECALPMGGVINALRWKKSTYEMEQMRAAGRIHRKVLEHETPKLLREGMNEADLTGALFKLMLKEGHHGLVRFSMFDTNLIMGQIAFGENAIYPTHFDGPGGNKSEVSASPFLGSRTRRLKKGDLVFIDAAVGVNGYHTDKTMIYAFGKTPSSSVIEEHRRCVEIKDRIAEQLRPGVLPQDIYNNIMKSLPADFLTNFMGFGQRKVKFLGHGIGLFIDEMPVIADRFTMPLEENMCFAVEPKKGIPGVGMVGVEETFVVGPNGGECITGNHPGLMVV